MAGVVDNGSQRLTGQIVYANESYFGIGGAIPIASHDDDTILRTSEATVDAYVAGAAASSNPSRGQILHGLSGNTCNAVG